MAKAFYRYPDDVEGDASNAQRFFNSEYGADEVYELLKESFPPTLSEVYFGDDKGNEYLASKSALPMRDGAPAREWLRRKLRSAA